MKLTIACAGVYCRNKFETEIALPEGWTQPDQAIEEGAPHWLPLCPDCAVQRTWFDAVCPGCVAGPPGCPLFRLFAHGRYSPGLSEAQRNAVSAGGCPVRVNGAFAVYGGRIESLNLSEQAPTESGVAVLAAIDAYTSAYPVGRS